jgi:hypothetical protein
MTDNEATERLRALKHRIDTDPPPVSPTDEMWPAIRSRIEAAKVEPLGQSDTPARGPHRRWLVPSLAIVVAAAIVVAVVLPYDHRPVGPQSIMVNAATGAVIMTSDSVYTDNYEEEERGLLNDLELRRSMLRPEAVAAIDHDLRVVDSAIAEVKDAMKHDPNNPALRRLLASSYREKLSVLQRVGNAG